MATALIGLAVVIWPLMTGLLNYRAVAYRDNLDVFIGMMQTPMNLILPLLTSFAVCTRLYALVGTRALVNFRTRRSIRSLFLRTAVAPSAKAFLLFALAAALAGIASFVVWPLIGNPSVRPDVYLMTPSEAASDALGRNNYAEFLSGGWPVFVLVSAVTFGWAAALCALTGCILLLVMRQRVLAFLAPFIIWVVWTVGAEIFESPHAAIAFSANPVGLSQVSTLESLAPLALATLAVGVLVLVCSRRLERAQAWM